MRNVVLRGITIALLVSALVSISPESRAAGELIGSNPADGATLDAVPDQVELTFDGSIDPETVQIVVIGPNGARADIGVPETTADDTRSIDLRPGSSDGSYLVSWLVAVPGGRATAFGDVRFSVAGATPCQPVSNATPRPPAEECLPDPPTGEPGSPMLRNGMIVTVSVSGDRAGPVDLLATIRDEAGAPIENATVWFRARHLEMDHGEFPYLAAESGPGVYRASGVGMGMGGQWRIAVDVILPGELPVTVFVEQSMVE